MITVGEIKDKYYSNDTLLYVVDFSIFKFQGMSSAPTIDATACVSPGVYEPYKIGDLVYVGFVNNEYSQPVVLGKIAKKFNEKEATSYNYINALEVTEDSKLPKSTQIGDLTYEDLYKAVTYVKQKTKEEENS